MIEKSISIINKLIGSFILYLGVLALPGCSQQALDKEIKADITGKAKEDINFAGVMYVVERGRVTLSGSCPTAKSREMVKQKLSTIHVIDSIEDHLMLAPVTLGPSFAIKQKVDSVLAKYPAVTAAVSDSAVVLIGKIKNADLNKLLSSLQKVHVNVNTGQLHKDMYGI